MASTALGSRLLFRVSWRRLLRFSSVFRSFLRSSFRFSFRDSVLASLRDVLRDSVLASLRLSSRDSLRLLPLRPRRRSSFWFRFWLLRELLRDSLREVEALTGGFSSTLAFGSPLIKRPKAPKIRAPKPVVLAGFAAVVLALTGADAVAPVSGAGLAG